MGLVGGILLVAFIIACALLVLLVLVQDDESNGMGGMIGGGSAAFGSRSANVVTKTTGVLVAVFFALAFFLALTTANRNKARQPKDLTEAAVEVQGEVTTEPASTKKYWEEDKEETEAPAVESAENTESAQDAAAEADVSENTAEEVE